MQVKEAESRLGHSVGQSPTQNGISAILKRSRKMREKKISGLQNDKDTAVKPFETRSRGGFENKEKFPLWAYPDTLEAVENMYRKDNCRSKSEFIEKAIKFYLGYLSSNENVNYLSPKITGAVDAVVHGSEQRINRNLFKIAVELGKLSHMIAAANDVNSETLSDLHAMCVEEVRRINGMIDFEKAVEYQRTE